MIFDSIKCLVNKGLLTEDQGKNISRIIANLPELKKDNWLILLGAKTTQQEDLMEYSNGSVLEYSNNSEVAW